MEKITVPAIVKKKNKEKIVMITSYDYLMTKLVDKAGVDGILVGDSVGMVLLGYETTLPVTMDEIAHHLKAVVRAKPRALVIADMPFLSYEVSKYEALRNAGKLIKLGAEAVKIEGGVEVIDKVEVMVKHGIPVMGHIGLTPQRMLKFGGYKLMGKKAELAIKLIEDAKALEDAGAFSIVIEFTAAEVAAEITRRLKIPTICIGSGPHCDGQIIVLHDILGLSENPPPFVKKYANLANEVVKAVSMYVEEVRKGLFPTEKHMRRMKPQEYKVFKDLLSKLKV